MKTTISILIGIACIVGFIALLSSDESQSEMNECLTWQQEAKDYSQFWLTGWQDSQCRAHGITINAPVKI